MRIWSVVAEMVGSHGRCALVTVAAVRGSAPREPGARMVIVPDGGFHGSIGGGELEWRAIGEACDALSRNEPAATLSRLILGPDLGQCCGGSVRLLTEVFDRDRLDEVQALAVREAAGPFVTRGRIGPGRVERIVDDGVAREAPGSARTSRGPINHPNIVDRTAGGRFAHESLPSGQGGDGDRGGGAHVGLPVELESDGVIVERFCDVDRTAGGGFAHESLPSRQGGDGDRGGGVHAGLSVELESDGVIVERFCDSRRPVWLFGAGHVGRALMLALAPLPFAVTWVDERADAFPAAVPANVHPLWSAGPVDEIARAPTGALVVVMTHSHAVDLAIVHAALAAGRFGYVGLIGSASKRARFTRRFREAGVAEARIAELVCPVGVPGIDSKHPAAIAAGVAVQLLERDEALAAPMRSVAIEAVQ